MSMVDSASAQSVGRTSLTGIARQGAGKVWDTYKTNPMGAFNLVTTGSSISQRMKGGDSFLSASFKEGVRTALYTTNPGVMTAIDMAPMAYQGVKAARDFRQRKAEEMYDMRYNMYGKVGGGYIDSNRALTMRQAAVQQIQGNKLNARSALGGEARIFANNIY